MKKFMLPLLAVILAVGFSAFNTIQKKANDQASVKKAAVEETYFWYDQRSDGKIGGDVLNPSAKDVKSNVISGGINELTPCDDTQTAPCLVGCSSSSLHNGDTPDAPTMSLDNRIHQN